MRTVIANTNMRVGGSEGIGRYNSPKIFIDTRPRYDDNVRVVIEDASDARALARRLKKWADFVDPPKGSRGR